MAVPGVLLPSPAPRPPYEAVPAPQPDAAPSVRRIVIRSRSNVRMQGKVFPSQDGSETIAAISSGVNVVVSGIQNVPGLADGKIDIETDRIVIWTARLDSLDLSGQSSGEKLQPKDAPLEFYLEGNIVFREGDRVIYAERMYYDVRQQRGIVLNAEVLTPAPGYQGLVRLKAEVLQQLDQYNFRATNGAVTSSRIGVPRYWLQAGEVSFQDVQSPRSDPLTGQFVVDPETGEPAVDHQYLATSRNNFLFLSGVPVLYWPVMATDLVKPNFYLDGLRVKNDNVYGFQVMADWDLYQLLGIRKPPEGTEWSLSTDYLSERGFALGTNLHYDRFGFLSIPGQVRGDFDAWGIHDTRPGQSGPRPARPGADDRGPRPRVLAASPRAAGRLSGFGRSGLDQRQQLPGTVLRTGMGRAQGPDHGPGIEAVPGEQQLEHHGRRAAERVLYANRTAAAVRSFPAGPGYLPAVHLARPFERRLRAFENRHAAAASRRTGAGLVAVGTGRRDPVR